MDRAVRNQEQIVFFSWKNLNKGLRIHRHVFSRAFLYRRPESGFAYPFLKAQVNLRLGSRIKNIISLILCKVFTKMFFYIVASRMTLQREVSSAKRIQKIESDWELVTKTGSRFSQNGFVILIHKKVETYFQQFSSAFQDNPILRSNELKRPGIVRFFLRQSIEMLLHPVTSPCASLKPWTRSRSEEHTSELQSLMRI